MPAGRDGAVFKDAQTFDPEAPREQKNIAFGRGVHICLGQFIAKAQVQEALPIIAARIRNPRRNGDVAWRPFMAITGLRQLPIAFDTA
ncbi:MAG: cytochrome P450 [Candidatus Tectomicrobia bacterium]|nr:cytochrome P450 [Candidatus Tectomicrobia bacterium]